jgi:hypothetical protein
MNPLSVLSSIDMLQRHFYRQSLPNGSSQMLAGLDCLMGVLGVSISTDKTVYKVGERPTYRISGGVPRGHIAWSSFKNGVSTGEFQADYPGEDLNDAGSLTIQGGPWSAGDVGDWQKQILIVPEDYAGDYGTLGTAQVEFTVGSSASASGPVKAATAVGKTGGFFDSKLTLPLVGDVPVIAVAGIGILSLLLFTGGSKGRK